MKQFYVAPSVTDYGSLLAVTGVTGARGFNDVQTYLSSNHIAKGSQSVNICPTNNFDQCLVRP